jgi:capsular exopolysaccharide synthesis family protein
MNIAASKRPAAPHAPAGNDGRPGVIAEQLVSLVAPGSVAADQYRTLRYSIERLRKDSGVHAIAVTSPSPGDGKTVTTLNLAGALAQGQDARVLVIDADLRKPSVADYLALDGLRSPGLSDALRDPRYELHQIIRHLKGFNLWVVPAGPPELTPYELLSSARLDALLREARRDFDCVLVDTPPSLLMPDCRLIERWVDGVVLVVAAHKTPRKLVGEALSQLDPAKMLGVVFNADDRPTSSNYGYYGYGR